MSEWQPIETYPNDDTPVLGFSARLANLGIQRGFMVVRRAEDKPGLESEGLWFTHWMPLPEPPT